MAAKELTDKLNDLARQIEMLLNERKTWVYEIKVYSNYVEVTFDWDYCFGWFKITPNEGGWYAIENEYYVERFDTIQQVVDYLVEKNDANGR